MTPAWERRRGRIHWLDDLPPSIRWRFWAYVAFVGYGLVMYLLGLAT